MTLIHNVLSLKLLHHPLSVQNSHKVPPPWLIAMQRYGPPPSYPNLKIPGLNSPIPEVSPTLTDTLFNNLPTRYKSINTVLKCCSIVKLITDD